jgi:hypothetical protein
MTCPDCNGKKTGCTLCGEAGTVPDWLADPKINGDAAKTWRKS